LDGIAATRRYDWVAAQSAWPASRYISVLPLHPPRRGSTHKGSQTCLIVLYIIDVLDLVKLASSWMFSCFLVGTILTFLCLFFAPRGFSKKPRWRYKTRRLFFRQLPLTILTFASLLFTAAGSVIATVMSVVFRNQFSQAAVFNIHASLGEPMLAFMWIVPASICLGSSCRLVLAAAFAAVQAGRRLSETIMAQIPVP
jgi:hypothetical protein